MTTPASAHAELPAPVQRRVRRYRVTAAIILALGCVAAAIVYWHASRAPDLSDDPAMLGFNRASERQLGVLYGRQGQLVEDLNESLRQPGTQALLVIAVSGLLAAGAFQFSRILEHEARRPADAPAPPPVFPSH